MDAVPLNSLAYLDSFLCIFSPFPFQEKLFQEIKHYFISRSCLVLVNITDEHSSFLERDTRIIKHNVKKKMP